MIYYFVGGLLIGMLLARFFKFYSLFPVAVLAIFAMVLNPFQTAREGWSLVTDAAVLVTMLQVGFLAGVALHGAAAGLRGRLAFAPRRRAESPRQIRRRV